MIITIVITPHYCHLIKNLTRGTICRTTQASDLESPTSQQLDLFHIPHHRSTTLQRSTTSHATHLLPLMTLDNQLFTCPCTLSHLLTMSLFTTTSMNNFQS